MVTLDPRSTALVLIDLQKGIIARELAPHPAATVMANAKELASRFRRAGATVVLVHVGFSKDMKDALLQPADKPSSIPPGGFPAEAMEFADGLTEPGDLHLLKRQWGAFHGTELDLQLRRRGIKTIVLGGVATNMGVESTARAAWEHGYALVLAEDATSSRSKEMHDFSITAIMPLIARVRKTAEIELKIGA